MGGLLTHSVFLGVRYRDAVDRVEQTADPDAVSTDLEEALIEAESLRSRLPRLNVLVGKHTVRIA